MNAPNEPRPVPHLAVSSAVEPFGVPLLGNYRSVTLPYAVLAARVPGGALAGVLAVADTTTTVERCGRNTMPSTVRLYARKPLPLAMAEGSVLRLSSPKPALVALQLLVKLEVPA